MAAGWSKRAVLRAGYGAVIAVLVLSTVEAYRIQVSVSRQHLEIYRHFVEQEEALSTLRRNLWLAGNYVREFFIQNTPEQGAKLVSQLQRLQEEDELALRFLERAPLHRQVVPALRKSLDEFWSIGIHLPQTMLHADNEAEIAFLQREVVPRRGELYNALTRDHRSRPADAGKQRRGVRRHSAPRRGTPAPDAWVGRVAERDGDPHQPATRRKPGA